jgi:diaminopimelate epimerase
LIEVVWREDGEVVMTGRADVVYSGEWLGKETDERGTMNAE